MFYGALGCLGGKVRDLTLLKGGKIVFWTGVSETTFLVQPFCYKAEEFSKLANECGTWLNKSQQAWVILLCKWSRHILSCAETLQGHGPKQNQCVSSSIPSSTRPLDVRAQRIRNRLGHRGPVVYYAHCSNCCPHSCSFCCHLAWQCAGPMLHHMPHGFPMQWRSE